MSTHTTRIAAGILIAAGYQTAVADLIASDDFDSPFNLVGYSAVDFEGNDPTNSGVWSSGSDNFGPRSMADRGGAGASGNTLSEALVDDSLASPGDEGILTPDYAGSFFAVVDTDNGANPSGGVTGTWTFDISDAISLTSFEVDLAAIGGWFDFGGSFERFTFSYSIDGGDSNELLTLRGDAGLGPVTYTFADGGTLGLASDDFENHGASVNGVFVDNTLTTFSAPLAGSGSELTLELFGFVNGNDVGFVMDNIRINGVIPAPGTAALTGCALIIAGRRRRA